MKKPTYRFTEMCTLISLIDCRQDALRIMEVLIMDTSRYTANEYATLSKLLKIRAEKYYTEL